MGTARPLTKKSIADLLNKGGSLARHDLRGLDLSGVCFDNADLTEAKLAGCNLSRATFRNANLTDASLWQTDCKDAVFDGALLDATDLDLANLDGASFKGARLKKAILPNGKVALDEITSSVRTGRRVAMSRIDTDP
jgi:uncharacterized protein YjbI with pentapeptide repeats